MPLHPSSSLKGELDHLANSLFGLKCFPVGWFVGISVGGLVLLYFFPPSEYNFYPRCPFYLLTGWKCPGCGTLRALSAVLHGDLRAAWNYAPAFPFSLLVIFLLIRFPALVRKTATPIVLFILIVAYTIGRNL